jgi:hypothetical protein
VSTWRLPAESVPLPFLPEMDTSGSAQSNTARSRACSRLS